MPGPTNDEQLELEYLEAARLDPLEGGAGLYLISAMPLTSSDSDIEGAITAFGVDGLTAFNAVIALTPVQPLAWNDNLAAAARTHNGFMISGDTQSHQVTTLGEASLGPRITAAGYTWTAAGENVYAYAKSDIYAEAGFFIDWGAGPGGMQSPPGHRDNIMGIDPNTGLPLANQYREIGIGITAQTPATPADVGPLVVTEDFGNRSSLATPLLLGVAYDDVHGDNNKFYSVGEGLGNLTVSVAGGGNVTSWASGGYTLAGLVGNNTVTFSGAELAGNVTVTLAGLTSSQNVKLDIVNGNELDTSGNVSVTGAVSIIRGTSSLGVSISTPDAVGRELDGSQGNDIITGSSANDILDGRRGDDILRGAGGNDSISGGSGIDTAVFSGNRSSYTITYSFNGETVTGPDGTDFVNQVEKASFADQTVTLGQGDTRTDFNTDNNSDILFQDSSGQAKIWLMNGTSRVGGGNVSSNPGTAWHVVGSGDFNDDGKSDILWRNNDGTVAIWFMNGTTLTGGGVAGNPGTTWNAIGVGDFNGDGHADILWQSTSGQAAVWLMNGTTIMGGSGLVGSNPGTTWKVIAAGDFTGDGNSDILWQSTSGQVCVWALSGTSVLGGNLVGPNPGTTWKAIGAGDFNGDGNSDILWQNSDGTPAIWLMGGGDNTIAPIVGTIPGFNPGTTWKAVGTGDFNGDGMADILWQNTDGTTCVWLMNGYSLIGGATGPFNVGSTWHAIGMSA